MDFFIFFLLRCETSLYNLPNDIGILMDVKTIEELKQNHETDN